MKRAVKPSQILRKIIASNYSSSINYHWSELLDQHEIDWPELVDEAMAIGLGPLLYVTIKETNATPNQSVMEMLHLTYLASATHNMLVMKELNILVDVLAQAELRHILLKGSALFQSAYPDPALRPMLDIDFLVPYCQVDESLEVLGSIGYSLSEPLPYHDDTGLVWNQLALSNESDMATPLELHWNLLDNPYYSKRISVAELWQRSIPHQMEQCETRLLSEEDLVIHLCAHNVFHHSGIYHRTAVDIGFTLKSYKNEFNWDRFLRYSVDFELASAARIALENASEDWYVDLPENIMSELNRYPTRKRERFFLAAQGSEFLKVFRTFVTIPGPMPKLRFILGQLFPSKEYMSWRYSINQTMSLPVAYIYRFLSGFTNLLGEIFGR